MPRVGLTPDAVVDIALELVDETGAQPTLAAIAARAGVAAPSLYKHIRNLAQLRRMVGARILDDVLHLLAAALIGLNGPTAVTAIMDAWRGYGHRYPHRYLLMPVAPTADPVTRIPADQIFEIIVSVLISGYGMTREDGIHATRRIRAAAHGFMVLELQGGFGTLADVDASYRQLVTMVCASLTPGFAILPQ